VIVPEASAAFVANMENVLEVYQRPHDPKRPLPKRPLVCLDETSKQLIVETRTPIAVKPGQPARLRIRAQWRGQSIHDVRAAGRLAARESH
jgi:hypothetical protein